MTICCRITKASSSEHVDSSKARKLPHLSHMRVIQNITHLILSYLYIPLHARAYVVTCTASTPRPRGLHSLAPSASSTLPSAPTLCPCSPSHSSILFDSEPKHVNTSILSMSSIRQATSSTSNVQIIIIAALANYTQITGTDLSNTPFAVALEQSNSPEVILQLLQERETAFKEYRDGSPRLMKCVSFAVKLIQPFSGIIREALSRVRHSCHPMTLLTEALSDPLPTDECPVCQHRRSPCCTSLKIRFSMFPVMNEHVRLPVESRRAMMLF